MFELVKNKRLALLGDRVLSLTMCMIWYQTGHTNKSYSVMESATLSRAALAVTAGKIRLNEALLRHSDSEIHSRDHLAEAFEAVIGAIYLDSNENLSVVKKVIQTVRLDQHRNLKTWEEMTEEERRMMVAENSEGAKRQDAKGQEGSTDYAFETAQVIEELTRSEDLSRWVNDLPIKQRRGANFSLQYVTRMAKSGKPVLKKAANLTLERYAGLLRAGHRKADMPLQLMFETQLRELKLADDIPRKDLSLADESIHASVTEAEGFAHLGEDQDSDFRMADEEPEVRKDQEEDKLWNAAGQKGDESVEEEDRAHQLEEGTQRHEVENELKSGLAKAERLESEEEEEKRILLRLERHTGSGMSRGRHLRTRLKRYAYEKRLARKLDHAFSKEPRVRENPVAINEGENVGKEESTGNIGAGDKMHQAQQETNSGDAELERSKRVEEDEENRATLWVQGHQQQERITEIREAEVQGNTLRKEAQNPEELLPIEEDTKARIVHEEINMCPLRDEETMGRIEEEEESSQALGYTADEKKNMQTWRSMLMLGDDNRSVMRLPAMEIILKASDLERMIYKTTVNFISMAELRRPRGWPTLDQLQEQVATAITSPYRLEHTCFEMLAFRPSLKLRRSIGKATLQGLRLGSAEWNRSVTATFHRATKMQLVVDTMEREGHVTHWKKESTDPSQLLFVQAWESAMHGGTSAGDFVRQIDEDKVATAGVHPTTELAIRAYAALERKLMRKTVRTDAEMPPWEEAVREAVRDQEEKRMRVAEEGEKGSADEVRERQKSINRRTVFREQAKDMERVRRQMVKWRSRLFRPTSLNQEERKARETGKQQLSAFLRIIGRLDRSLGCLVTLTMEIIALSTTQRTGDWSPHPPVTQEQLQKQAEEYCQPRKLMDSLRPSRQRYYHAIRYATEQGLRIGSKEWNEIVEASFRRFTLMEMSFRHTEFTTSMELQNAALETELQFVKQLANILRHDTSLSLLAHHDLVPWKEFSRLQHNFLGPVLPSELYRNSDEQATLPRNFVLRELLRKAEQGTIEAGMLTSPAPLPTTSIALLEGFAPTLDVAGSGWTDVLPITGTLAIIRRAEEATNKRVASRPEKAPKHGKQQPVVSNAMVTDPLMEAERVSDLLVTTSVAVAVNDSSKPEPVPALECIRSEEHKDTLSGSESSSEFPPASVSESKSAEPDAAVAGVVSAFRLWREAQEEAQTSSTQAPASSKSASKKQEARRRVATSISKSSWRKADRSKIHKAPSRKIVWTPQSALSSKSASTKAKARERMTISKPKASSRENDHSWMHRSRFSNTDQPLQAPPPPNPASGNAEPSPRHPKARSTSRQWKNRQVTDQSSSAQGSSTPEASPKSHSRVSLKVSPASSPSGSAAKSANAPQGGTSLIRKVQGHHRRGAWNHG